MSSMIQFLTDNFKFYAPIFIAILVSIFFAMITHFFIYKLLLKYFKAQESLFGIFLYHIKNPFFMMLCLLYLTFATSVLGFTVNFQVMRHVAKILFVLVTSWSILKIIDYLDIWLMKKSSLATKGLHYGGLIAKYQLLKNFAKLFIFIITISLLLLSFDSVREIGKGLLVSAGVASAILALSAQKLVSNVISGLQLAFTKPIKIGDVLGIDGEVGTIEELTSTNVTLRLWDLRRLVLPLNYLIDKSFIHFTQPDPSLIGPIPLHVDYSIDIEELRGFLMDTLSTSPLWDKKIGKLEVIDLKQNSLQLRALVSASNTVDLWNLSCEIREKVVKFVNEKFPHCFPVLRAQIDASSNSKEGA